MSKIRLIMLFVFLSIFLSSTMLLDSMTTPTLVTTGELSDDSIVSAISSGSESSPNSHGYVVIELPGANITAHGADWSQILNESGLASRVLTVAQILAEPHIIDDVSGIIIDGSLGSNNGSAVSDELIDILVREDRPLILLGRAAWICPRLRETLPSTVVASVSPRLVTASGFESAVFLSSPNSLTPSAVLTLETGLPVPLCHTQAEKSRLINLTASESPDEIAPLRYTSYPTDTFLFGPENPARLTTDGRGFFVNVVAYSTALRESTTSDVITSWQVSQSSALYGGLRYPHEPTIKFAYYVVHSVYDLLDSSAWSSWSGSHRDLITGLLNCTIDEGPTEIGFKVAESATAIDVKSTGQALWLISKMSLTAYYDVDKIVTYLSARQSVDGGFDDDIVATYIVTEALASVGRLNSIDTGNLESWYRDCVIDGSKTSDPAKWGGVAENPASTTPQNSYALAMVSGLEILGTTHNDPVKLTQWIQQTSNGDGSYSDSLDGSYASIGTGAALATMSILGTLNSQNRTAGLYWFESNQVSSGGFGFGYISDDLVGKTLDTSYVATCLSRLGETTSSVASGILNYVDSIETSVGYERMELVPSLMWTSWMMQSARYSHSADYVDYEAARSFLSNLNGWNQYPSFGNMSFLAPREYDLTQYRIRSVWTQYLGVMASFSAGHALTVTDIQESVNFIVNSQSSSGHFRPTMYFGVPMMQHSVVAVEALYQMGYLDQIKYRSALESSILAEYNGGTWSSDDWDLRPFEGLPVAIDWLSTRAALRLGLLNASMVNEIVAAIQARIQYQDLLALSYDVATLALLEANGYAASVDIVDAELVLSALGPNPFASGWYNDTILWQPLYTTSVLRMVSILGLRPRIFEGHASSLTATGPSDVDLGSDLSISVTVASNTTNHTLSVYAFGSWVSYCNVSDSDTILITVPNEAAYLGPSDIYLIVVDYGSVRASQRLSLTVTSELVGSMALDSTEIRIGDPITGLVDWALTTDAPADITNITIRLGDPPVSQEWYDQSTSPFNLSVPTDAFDAGRYNLTVTLEHPYCSPLVLRDVVQLYTPVATFIDAVSNIETNVTEPVPINWSLRYVGNNSIITGETVSLEVINGTGYTVYTATDDTGQFVWTPDVRGSYTYHLKFDGDKSLMPSNFTGTINVYEPTNITTLIDSQYDQYGDVTLTVLLTTDRGQPLVGLNVTLVVQSPSMATVAQSVVLTDSSGHASITVYLSENGPYTLSAIFDGREYLLSTSETSEFVSWTSSHLALGGIPTDGHVGEENSIFVNLTDSASSPLPGQSVTVTITYLPSTIVATYDLTTDSQGVASFTWTATTAGSYLIEAHFAGTSSIGASSTNSSTNMWMPVTLTIIVYENPEVGVPGWITITAEDVYGGSISDLSISLTVRGPSSLLSLQTTGVTSGGTFTSDWTPSERGLNNVTVTSVRQSWYDAAVSMVQAGVYEATTVTVALTDDPIAPGTAQFQIEVTDSTSHVVSGCSVHTVVRLDGTIIMDVTNSTDASGLVILSVYVDHPGTLEIETSMGTQNWLLASTGSLSETVPGTTTMTLTTPGQPVAQGTTIGILVTLVDWNGDPISGVTVTISVSESNGPLIYSENRTTGLDGTAALAYQLTTIGDFLINATYYGSDLNAPASESNPQRVYVIPDVIVETDSVCYLNDTLEILVGVRDAIDSLIPDRTLQVTIQYDGVTVFDQSVLSGNTLVSLNWTPTARGLVTVTVLHIGDLHYYTNETSTQVSIMEIVTGELLLSADTIEFNDNVTILYALAASDSSNVTTVFQVLGVDLVPIWSMTVTTNSTGYANVTYVAEQATGILTIRVGPATDQYMLGGDQQKQLTVMTDAQVTIDLLPDPPCAGEVVNITIDVSDELGIALNDLSLTVSALDPYGEPVKLGAWSYSVTAVTSDGLAIVEMNVDVAGLYTIEVSFYGSTVVHPFDVSSQHIIFSRTAIQIIDYSSDIEVGESFMGIARLVDHSGSGMAARDVTLTINGPGGAQIGPLTLVTNGTGYIEWNITLDDEGVWDASFTFAGLGVYLESTTQLTIDVRYRVLLTADVISTETPIAGVLPVDLALMLTDAGGTVLEGFTIGYSVYHEVAGQILDGSVVQASAQPVNLSIMLPQMGVYTVVVEFQGTSHYYPASVALEIFALGTVEVSFSNLTAIDRSQSVILNITFSDELSNALNLDHMTVSILLEGSQGLVALDDRLSMNGSIIAIDLYALQVGTYNLTVVVDSTDVRVGSTNNLLFDVVASTKIIMLSEDFDGLVGDEHSFSLTLQDSLGTNMTDSSVTVFIFDPNGKEVLGTLLHQGRDITIGVNGVTVSWTPMSTGWYIIRCEYYGDAYHNASAIETDVLVRLATSIKVDAPSSVKYGDDVLVIATLQDAFGPIRSVPVLVYLTSPNGQVRLFNGTTDWNGIVKFGIFDLYADNYSIRVVFKGTDTHVPVVSNRTISVVPAIAVRIVESHDTFIESTANVSLFIQVNGVLPDWTGSVSVVIEDPTGELIKTLSYAIGPQSVINVLFVPIVEGSYSIRLTVNGLPVIDESSYLVEVGIGPAPAQLQMDSGTASVAVGLPLLIVIGVVVSRKAAGAISRFPQDWA